MHHPGLFIEQLRFSSLPEFAPRLLQPYAIVLKKMLKGTLYDRAREL